MQAEIEDRVMENCKKVAFDTWWDAGARLKEIKKESDREEIPQRTYKCEKCGKWHLTKITQKEKQKKDVIQNERIRKREESFINRETQYWEKKFKIN